MSNYDYAAIVKAVNEAHGFIGDDNDPITRAMVSGIALLHRDGVVTPVGLFDEEHFTLNEVYLKDGKVRLSRRSVGGLMFRDMKPVFGGLVPVDLRESVVTYNTTHATNEHGTAFLTNFYKMRLGQLVPVKLFEEGEVAEMTAAAFIIDEARRAKIGHASF
ncbi:hypothetical protein D3C79_49990 [compost metagenome]